MSNQEQFTTLLEDFEICRKQFIPKGSKNDRVIENRRFFFFGATSIMMDMDKIGALDSPEVGVQILETMRQELINFQADVQAGKA